MKEEEEESLHAHCVTCHRNDCRFLPDHCPVVECSNECGIHFHKCKEAEHLRICRCRLRPCVNVKNGCTAQVTSTSLLYHLQVCPANVVVCTHSWRTDSPLYQYLKIKKHSNTQTDDTEEADISKLSLELNADTWSSSKQVVDIPFSFDSPQPDSTDDGTWRRWKNNCHEILRRDQFKWHMKNVHDDIPDQFRSLVQVCPFAQYGCSFVQFAVKPKYRELRFSKHFNLFRDDVASVQKEVEKQECLSDTWSLLDIDFDIFMIIFSYLDNLSLARLSQTCRQFRDLCSEVLDTEGVVFPVWSKSSMDGKQSWKISKTVRKFTVSFAPIREWVRTDVPCLGNHARTCKYNDKMVMTGPVKLPGMGGKE